MKTTNIFVIVLSLTFCTRVKSESIFTTIYKWITGPDGIIIIDNLENAGSIFNIISTVTSGNSSVNQITVEPWFGVLNVATGVFPITGQKVSSIWYTTYTYTYYTYIQYCSTWCNTRTFLWWTKILVFIVIFLFSIIVLAYEFIQQLCKN